MKHRMARTTYQTGTTLKTKQASMNDELASGGIMSACAAVAHGEATAVAPVGRVHRLPYDTEELSCYSECHNNPSPQYPRKAPITRHTAPSKAP